MRPYLDSGGGVTASRIVDKADLLVLRPENQGIKSSGVGSGLFIGVSRYGDVCWSDTPSEEKNRENCC